MSGASCTSRPSGQTLLGRPSKVHERVVDEAHIELGTLARDRVRPPPETLVVEHPGLLVVAEFVEHAAS